MNPYTRGRGWRCHAATLADVPRVRLKPDTTSEGTTVAVSGFSRTSEHMCQNDRILVVKRALLISTYDLGHQPFGLASPAAWLRREGLDVQCIDLSKEKLADESAVHADLIAFHLPMHTATRLAAPVIKKVRVLNPDARLCAYGLYPADPRITQPARY